MGRITPSWKLLKFTTPAMARSTVLGFIAGVLPGAGASLGSFLAYTAEKQISDKDGTFGKGDPRGVAAPEAGNNAAAGGALVPMLALGVPGSGTTAVLLAVLLALNITPGPLLFTQNPDVVWGLIAALFIANFMLLAMNIPMVGLFARVLLIPPRIPDADRRDDLLRRHLRHLGFDLRSDGHGRLRCAGLGAAETRRAAGSGDPWHASGQPDGGEPAPRDDDLGR